MQLIHGDCLEKMKDIPDKSVDMILCDLPYGTTACKWDTVIPFNKYVQIGEKVIYEQEYVFDKMKSGVSYKEALEDFLSISKDGLWDNYNRVIKDRGAIVLFGSEPFSSYLRMSNIKQFKYDWIWDKVRPSGFQIAKYNPMKRHEIISVFQDGSNWYPQKEKRDKPVKGRVCSSSDSSPLKYNDGKVRVYDEKNPQSIVVFSKQSDGKYIHPTQKPVALLEYLIKTYTLEGETILDNCMGSGSTGIACINTNRNFIGIEKDDKYFEIAKKRIADAIKDHVSSDGNFKKYAYGNYSKLVYKRVLGKDVKRSKAERNCPASGNLRDYLTIEELDRVQELESKIAGFIEVSDTEGKDDKQIYQMVKAWLDTQAPKEATE